MTKADLHELVDELPEEALDGAAFLLEWWPRVKWTQTKPGVVR